MPSSLALLSNQNSVTSEEVTTLKTHSAQELRNFSIFWKGGVALSSGPIDCWPAGELESWTHVLWFRALAVPGNDVAVGCLYEAMASGSEGEEEYGPYVKVSLQTGSDLLRVMVGLNPAGDDVLAMNIAAPLRKDNCLVITQAPNGSNREVRVYLNGAIAQSSLAVNQIHNFGPSTGPLLANNGTVSLGGDVNSSEILNGSIIHSLGFSRNSTTAQGALTLYKLGPTFDFRYAKFDWPGSLTNYWNAEVGAQLKDEVGTYHFTYLSENNAVIQASRIISASLPVLVAPGTDAGHQALLQLGGFRGVILYAVYMCQTSATTPSGQVRLWLRDGGNYMDINTEFRQIGEVFNLDLDVGGLRFTDGVYVGTTSTSGAHTPPTNAFVHLLVAVDT